MPFAILFACVVACALLAQQATAEQHRAYFGTYSIGDSTSQGIYTCLFDSQTGRLTDPQLAVEAVNPSFLAIHPSGDFLFAVNEVSEGGGRGNGSVSSFRLGPDGDLTLINQQPSHGGAPCHCNVDASGKFLLIANYSGGSLAVYPISEDGSLEEASSVMEHEGSSVDPRRQQSPHAHSINLSRDNQFAYAADLGIDQVRIYRFHDRVGTLEPASPDSVSVTPGGGPRHFSIHPSGDFAYTNQELTSVVTAFRRDPESGALTAVQELSTLPEDYDARNSTAECLVGPSGRFLYVSNRGHDSIAVFAIDPSSGELSRVAVTHTEGRTPRNFNIDPSGRWLLAANQNSNRVVVFSINPETGAISPTDNQIDVARPVCIRFLVTE